jgi:hypothetical protein
MIKLNRTLGAALALGALFLAGSIMESRESKAKGGYSTPVQVMNTSSAPAVSVDAERLARIPYQSAYLATTCTGVTSCFFRFSPAPAGYRLVVENVSGWFQLSNGAGPANGVLESSNVSNIFLCGFTTINGPISNGLILASVNQSTRMLFDPSDGAPAVFVTGNFPAVTGVNSDVTLTGYLENCSITGCPAIQR